MAIKRKVDWGEDVYGGKKWSKWLVATQIFWGDEENGNGKRCMQI